MLSVVSGFSRHSLERIQTINVATKTLTAADSGTIFLLDRAAGITITLPSCDAGLYYEFFVITTFTGNFQINAASSADKFFPGSVLLYWPFSSGAIDGNHQILNWDRSKLEASPGEYGFVRPDINDHKYSSTAANKGRHYGTRLIFKGLNDGLWNVEGAIFHDSSNFSSPFGTGSAT